MRTTSLHIRRTYIINPISEAGRPLADQASLRAFYVGRPETSLSLARRRSDRTKTQILQLAPPDFHFVKVIVTFVGKMDRYACPESSTLIIALRLYTSTVQALLKGRHQ